MSGGAPFELAVGTPRITLNSNAVAPVTLSVVAPALNARSFANIAGRNGGFEVWQRGTSISVAASSNVYTCDGWLMYSQSNTSTWTISRQAGLTDGSRYSARVQRNNGQIGVGAVAYEFAFDVDELKKMAGQSVIFQFTLATGADWSPASGAISANIVVGTGAVSRYNGIGYTGLVQPLNLTTDVAAGSAAQAIYSPVVAIPPNISQASIFFGWTPVGAAGANDWFQIDDVDFRVAPAVADILTPSFERSDFVWDLERCRVHYETSYSYGTAPGTATFANSNFTRNIEANAFLVTASCKVEKRAVSTVIVYSAGSGLPGKVWNGAAVADMTAIVDQVGSSSFRVSSSGTAAAGDGCGFQWAMDSSI